MVASRSASMECTSVRQHTAGRRTTSPSALPMGVPSVGQFHLRPCTAHRPSSRTGQRYSSSSLTGVTLSSLADFVYGHCRQRAGHCGCVDAIPARVGVEHRPAHQALRTSSSLALLCPQQLGEELGPAASTQRV